MIYSQILFISSFSSLKDIKIVIFFLCPRAPGDSFEIGVAGCDLAAPIDREFRLRNLFTRNFHVAERKYSVYVTAFVRGPVRCFLVRVDATADISPSRVQPFPFTKPSVGIENSSCDSDKWASFTKVSRVEFGKPRAELRTAARDLAFAVVKRAI